MTTNTGETTAPVVTPDGGAGTNQPSEAEVTKLRADLESQTALVATRDTELESATTQISSLTEANTKFASDMAGLATVGQQLKDSNQALEESRKTSTELQTQLETSNTTNAGLKETMMSSRRKELIATYGLPEEHVAGLDEAGLKTLEATLPLTNPGKTTTTTPTPPNGSGYGMGDGGGSVDVTKMSAMDGALRLIEKAKSN